MSGCKGHGYHVYTLGALSCTMCGEPKQQAKPRCQAQVWRKDTYRRTGRGRSGFEMHYNRGRCKRNACDGTLCRQHLRLKQEGANIMLAEDWMT